MQKLRTVQQEIAEDIFFGQLVSIWARWFLIFAGTILALWSTSDETQLSLAILPVIALMAMNFFLHGRYIVEQPANRILIVAASVLDLAIITLIVAFLPGENGLGGVIATTSLVDGSRVGDEIVARSPTGAPSISIPLTRSVLAVILRR